MKNISKHIDRALEATKNYGILLCSLAASSGLTEPNAAEIKTEYFEAIKNLMNIESWHTGQPDVDGYYLVCHKPGRQVGKAQFSRSKNRSFWFIEGVDAVPESILFWRYLPAPPEVEK